MQDEEGMMRKQWGTTRDEGRRTKGAVRYSEGSVNGRKICRAHGNQEKKSGSGERLMAYNWQERVRQLKEKKRRRRSERSHTFPLLTSLPVKARSAVENDRPERGEREVYEKRQSRIQGISAGTGRVYTE